MGKENNTVTDMEAITKKARKQERHRILELNAVGKHRDLEKDAERFIENGSSVAAFHEFVWAELQKRDDNVETVLVHDDNTYSRGDGFSFQRLIASQIPGSNIDANEENRISKELTRSMGRKTYGSLMPMGQLQKRTLVAGTDSAGGHTVATELMATNFIEMLRNKSRVMQLNPTVFDGLTGDVAIPKQDGTVTTYYLTEGESVPKSDASFNQITLSPTTIAARTSYSRMALLQSSIDMEQFVRDDLATALALGVDLACINGSGVGSQPTGILNTAGIGLVDGGDNGLQPAWGHVVDLQSTITSNNALQGSMGFLTNSKVVGRLMQTEKVATTGEFIIKDLQDSNGFTKLGGANCGVSNNVPSTLDKGTSMGVCSAIIYGNWSDLIIGYWGGLDIIVDPFTNSDKGQVNVTAFLSFDIAVKHAESFAAMKDVLV